jgi:hypothetical protein
MEYGLKYDIINEVEYDLDMTILKTGSAPVLSKVVLCPLLFVLRNVF